MSTLEKVVRPLRIAPVRVVPKGGVVRSLFGRVLWVVRAQSRRSTTLYALSGVSEMQLPASTAVVQVTSLSEVAVLLGRASVALEGWAECVRLSLDGEHVAVDLGDGAELSASFVQVVEAWERLCRGGREWECPGTEASLLEASGDDAALILRTALMAPLEPVPI